MKENNKDIVRFLLENKASPWSPPESNLLELSSDSMIAIMIRLARRVIPRLNLDELGLSDDSP